MKLEKPGGPFAEGTARKLLCGFSGVVGGLGCRRYRLVLTVLVELAQECCGSNVVRSFMAWPFHAPRPLFDRNCVSAALPARHLLPPGGI